MSQVQELLMCLRTRDFEPLEKRLLAALGVRNNGAARVKLGKIRYDGNCLIPLLQTGDRELSKALLSNSDVCNALQSDALEHDAWIVDIATKDTGAWIWALEQGWGKLLEPRPSVLKSSTIVAVRAAIDQYFFDPKWARQAKAEPDDIKKTWDAWLRLASNRNPWLIGEFYTPQYKELVQLARCRQKFELPKCFWKNLNSVYPGAMAMRSDEQAMYAALGLPYKSEEERTFLGKIIGLAPAVEDSIPMEFEPGH